MRFFQEPTAENIAYPLGTPNDLLGNSIEI